MKSFAEQATVARDTLYYVSILLLHKLYQTRITSGDLEAKRVSFNSYDQSINSTSLDSFIYYAEVKESLTYLNHMQNL